MCVEQSNVRTLLLIQTLSCLVMCWGEAGLHYSSACFIREKWLHLLATPRCGQQNKARRNFVMTNSSAVNPVREAQQRRWPGPARLVLIQVHILERPWTNDQISCRAMKQVTHFNLENAALNGLSCWLSGFVEKSDLGAALSDYKGQKKEKDRVIEPSAPENFSFELFLFFWCCFDVAGLILCYSPPQGTVNTEGLGEDELGQDKRHTPQQRLQHNSNRAELPLWLLAYFSVKSGIHPSSSGMHHHCILAMSGLSKE